MAEEKTIGAARKNATSALHNLSTREVQTAREGDHSDGGGLLLRVQPKSSSWVFRYTALTGRRREMGLGAAWRATAAQAGESVSAARKAAREARDQLQAAIDPIDERERRRGAAVQAELEQKAKHARVLLTVARAAREYHERVVEPRLTAKHSAQWISLDNHVPPAIWNAPIPDVTAPMLLHALSGVRALEDSTEHVPETLQRVRQRLDAVFEDAIFHGRCLSNPAAAAIKRKMRETMPTTKRGEFAALPYREAPSFMERLREAQGIAPRCLEFAMLTVARTTEALTVEWSELDLAGGTWIVPAEKMRRPFKR